MAGKDDRSRKGTEDENIFVGLELGRGAMVGKLSRGSCSEKKTPKVVSGTRSPAGKRVRLFRFVR